MIMRIDWDEYFLTIAAAVSRRSTCLRRQYGAIIVNRDKTIVGTGYNGSPRGEENCCDVGKCNREGCEHNDGNYGQCRSVHAEQNVLINASKADMIGATLYLAGFENGQLITAEPCPICSRMIKNAGIKCVVGTKK